MADEQIAPQEGVSQVEVTVLAVAAANMAPGFSATKEEVQKDAECSGLTRTGFHVALRRLMRRSFVILEDVKMENGVGEEWIEQHVKLDDRAWDWIDSNASLFSFIKRDDDIPF